MVAAGVPRDDISTANGDALVAVIDRPDVATIQAALPHVIAVFAAQPDYTVNNANVQLFLDSCAQYTEAARDDAIRAAREKAESTAKALGVRLGSVLGYTETDQPIGPLGRCSNMFTIPAYTGQEARKPSDFLSVRVTASVTIRYAIK